MSKEANPWGTVLADFRPAILHPPLPQQLLLDYTVQVLAVSRCARENVTSASGKRRVHAEIEEQVRRYGVRPEVIAQRQACLLPPADLSGPTPRMPEALSGLMAHIAERPQGPTLDERMTTFRALVERFLEARYGATDTPPDDIVHVTTTGYLLPSAVQRMVSARRWSRTVVTHSYHMGCYGALPGVRTAVGLLATGHVLPSAAKSRVDILHTEAVSLHVDPTLASSGNIVTATLFGDGFISYSAYPEREARARGVRGLRVLSLHEQILPNTTEDMTLTPGPYQFDMHLSIRVPVRIRDAVRPFVNELCRKAGVDFEADRDRFFMAFHPGGTKILDVVAEALEIDERKMALSAEVLRDHGNMASATVPHVWHRIVDDDAIPSGTLIVTAAFGPGLTMTGMLLEKT